MRKHNVNLEFSNDKPMKMHFKNIVYLESVSSISPVTSSSKDHTEQLSKSNVLFSQLKNKIFRVKADKNCPEVGYCVQALGFIIVDLLHT